jgi:glycosyltransferase involved in cell wall biosynthesis
LLGGTGSNVYTRALAREWSLAGHDVTVVCQERHPELYDLGGAHVVVPDLPGGLLPVFVLDRYEGLEAQRLVDFTPAQRAAYVEANAAALRELAPADLVFANHVLLGAPVGAASGMRFRVKAHGSELEYAMRGNEELSRWGAETLAGAEIVYAGSEHIRDVLEEVVGRLDRVDIVPPGVDVDEFRPEPREEALAELLEEARADPPNPDNREERLPDEGNAARFARFFAEQRPTVVYFGKLIENKGVQVVLEAIAGLDARAVVVGFGDFREQLEALAPLGTLFTGPLEHRHLRHLLPLCDVAVVPSIFPEAFGMVAAEAAAAGVLPVVSGHSGLAEVAAGIGEEVGPDSTELLSFPAGDAAALRERLTAILALPPERRRELGLAARRAVEKRWSWKVVAALLLAALLAGCGGSSRRLGDGQWYRKLVTVDVAHWRMKFAPACIVRAGRWVAADGREPMTVGVTAHPSLAIYFRPNGDASEGHGQPADMRLLAGAVAEGPDADSPPGWFVRVRRGSVVSVAQDSGLRSAGKADKRTFACVWSKRTQAFVK